MVPVRNLLAVAASARVDANAQDLKELIQVAEKVVIFELLSRPRLFHVGGLISRFVINDAQSRLFFHPLPGLVS